MATGVRRWDTDERGRGSADVQHGVQAIKQLAELAGTPGRITEDARAHLLPGMESDIERAGFRLSSAVVDPDGALSLVLRREGRSLSSQYSSSWGLGRIGGLFSCLNSGCLTSSFMLPS